MRAVRRIRRTSTGVALPVARTWVGRSRRRRSDRRPHSVASRRHPSRPPVSASKTPLRIVRPRASSISTAPVTGSTTNDERQRGRASSKASDPSPSGGRACGRTVRGRCAAVFEEARVEERSVARARLERRDRSTRTDRERKNSVISVLWRPASGYGSFGWVRLVASRWFPEFNLESVGIEDPGEAAVRV